MTVAEMVDKFGEVRISRIEGIKHGEKGTALVERTVVNNEVVERNVPEIHYRVSVRDGEPRVGNTVDEALAKVE